MIDHHSSGSSVAKQEFFNNLVEDRERMIKAYAKLFEHNLITYLYNGTLGLLPVILYRFSSNDDAGCVFINISWESKEMKRKKIAGYHVSPIIVFPTIGYFITPCLCANRIDSNIVETISRYLTNNLGFKHNDKVILSEEDLITKNFIQKLIEQ